MSFRGRGGSNFRGRGGSGAGGRFDQGPPAEIIGESERFSCSYFSDIFRFSFSHPRAEMGQFFQACENDIVCKSTSDKIPKFVSSIFLENKQEIGKVDEIFGPINEVVSINAPTHPQHVHTCVHARTGLTECAVLHSEASTRRERSIVQGRR
jgi:H/ACA ribonucleoprotein complex subunit 1